MKTSNKIIASFLGFCSIILIITSLVSHNFSKNINRSFKGRVVEDVTPLDDFSVIVIKKAGIPSIISSDKNELVYASTVRDDGQKPEWEAIQKYEVKNDTLFIEHLLQAPNGGYSIKVKNLKSVVVFNTSQINFMMFQQDSLKVYAHSSVIGIGMNSGIDWLYFKGENSAEFRAQTIDKLEVKLDQSNVTIDGSINEISGEVGNHSVVRLPSKVQKMNLVKAETARININ